ncbi:MAG TPA: xylulose 5-phosphate 3-epimerase, partial [Dehalococcoidia bacterium]|nr:xylulose 5-phosphate 3-epimerase [Dehalococcoidia bacterium]
IFEMESRLEAATEALRTREEREQYPLKLPYGIATAPKGAGFPGAGTNLAHNLPLIANPSTSPSAAYQFNEGARRLWVPLPQLNDAASKFKCHSANARPKERDHALVHRQIRLREVPTPLFRPVPGDRRDPAQWTRTSPMHAIDAVFSATVRANPQLRPRVGNPDEMRSNRLLRTLDYLKFRVTDPEPGVPEDIHGSVVTALNEDSVVSAALANKGGINLVHTYEAFGAKMQGVMRQEIIFTGHCKEVGRPQDWLSVPLVLTSHTWENSKNELSHQDPAMAESMLGELSDVSRVMFLADYNTATAVIQGVYQTHGQFWTIVATKNETAPDLFTADEAAQLLEQGALRLDWAGHHTEQQRLIVTALGSYQLEEVIKASNRLAQRDIPHSVVYLLEPGRFRAPRSDEEREHAASDALTNELYPASVPARIFVTHTRPEPVLGTLQPLNTGYGHTSGLGFLGRGGTLTPAGMLF